MLFDIFSGKKVSGGKAGFFSAENVKTATNYMVLKMYCQDYQTVIKKQGANGIPP